MGLISLGRKNIQNWKVHILMEQTKKERVHILTERGEYIIAFTIITNCDKCEYIVLQ